MQDNPTTPRVNLLRAHGSPSRYMYRKGCRCIACSAVQSRLTAAWHADHRAERAAYRASLRDYLRVAHAEYNATHKAEMHAYDRSHRKERSAGSHNRRARKQGNGGSHNAADVRSQHARQKGHCYWCGVKVGKKYHVDHVIPLALGGSNGPENIVIACPPCNLSKNAKHPMDFGGCLF